MVRYCSHNHVTAPKEAKRTPNSAHACTSNEPTLSTSIPLYSVLQCNIVVGADAMIFRGPEKQL